MFVYMQVVKIGIKYKFSYLGIKKSVYETNSSSRIVLYKVTLENTWLHHILLSGRKNSDP